MAAFRAALKQHKTVRVFGLGHLLSPALVDIIALKGGWDAVWFDLEHVQHDAATVKNSVRAAKASGLGNFVRVTASSYDVVSRALDAGAGGLMAAMVRNSEQAQQIVQWAKFYPHGSRGFNGTGPDGNYGLKPALQYIQEANENTVVGIQIEVAEAIQNLDAIARVPHIDFLFVGPYDLSQSLGVPGDLDHPCLWQAIRQVASVAKANRVAWGILPPHAEYAERCADLGATLFSIGLDTLTFSRGLTDVQRTFPHMFNKLV